MTARFASVIAICAAAFALPASAQISDSASITFNAIIDPVCSTDASASTVISLNTMHGGSIVDSDGTLKAELSIPMQLSQLIAPPAVWCNGVFSAVSLSANPMVSATAAGDPDFTNRIDFSFSDWVVDGDIALPDFTTVAAADGAVQVTSGPVAPGRSFSGPFDGRITIIDTGLKLVAASDYSMTFTITFQAL